MTPSCSAPYRVLLLATDLSEASRGVFPAAAILARRFGARVVGVHVAPVDPAARPATELVRSFLRPDFEDVSVRIEDGAPWRAIVRAAEGRQTSSVWRGTAPTA